MALTTDQKFQVFDMVQALVPVMSDAEFLRATIVQASAWNPATDPPDLNWITEVIVEEINKFRTANPDGASYIVNPSSDGTQTVTVAPAMAKIGL